MKNYFKHHEISRPSRLQGVSFVNTREQSIRLEGKEGTVRIQSCAQATYAGPLLHPRIMNHTSPNHFDAFVKIHIASIFKDFTSDVSRMYAPICLSLSRPSDGHSHRKCSTVSSSESHPRHMALFSTPMVWRCFPRQCPVNMFTSTLVLFLQLDRSASVNLVRRCTI